MGIRWHGVSPDDWPGKGLAGYALKLNISMAWDMSGYKAKNIFEELEKTASEVNSISPEKNLRGFQVEVQGREFGSKWMQMRTDEVMQTASVYGLVVSCAFVFVILAVATLNWLLALMSTVTIIFIIVCCMGFMYVSMDGTYGFMGDLGISVTGACITTFGAALFMIPNRMVPFKKMGMFICFDIFMSLFFAVGFFSALLIQFGPINACGSLRLCRSEPAKVDPQRNNAVTTGDVKTEEKGGVEEIVL